MPISSQSRILTQDGIRKIREVADTESILLNFNDSLKARDKNEVKYVGKKYTWRVRTDKGTYLLSYNSIFMLEDGSSVSLKNLKVGDRLVSCLVDSKEEEVTVSVDPSTQESFYSLIIRDLVDGEYSAVVRDKRVQVVEHVGFCERLESCSCGNSSNYLMLSDKCNEGIFIKEDV
jgi:hypothetical protein